MIWSVLVAALPSPQALEFRALLDLVLAGQVVQERVFFVARTRFSPMRANEVLKNIAGAKKKGVARWCCSAARFQAILSRNVMSPVAKKCRLLRAITVQTSNTGSRSFGLEVRGGAPGFMAR